MLVNRDYNYFGSVIKYNCSARLINVIEYEYDHSEIVYDYT